MNPNPPSTAPAPPPRLGLAIASLVLGILAFVFSLILVGAVFGLVGLVLGLVHVAQKRGRNAMAWWGVGLSVLGIMASIGLSVLYYQGYKAIKATVASMAGDLGGSGSPDAEWEGVMAPDISVTALD